MQAMHDRVIKEKMVLVGNGGDITVGPLWQRRHLLTSSLYDYSLKNDHFLPST